MIGSLGVPELLFILVLALLVFGPKRLPEIGRTIGKGLAEFRRASNDLKRTINSELALEEDDLPARSGPAWLAPAGTQVRVDGEPPPPATVTSGPAPEVVAMMEAAPEAAPELAIAAEGSPGSAAPAAPAAPADTAAAPSPHPLEPG